MTPPANLGPARKLAYSLVAVALFLGLGEGAARLWELWLGGDRLPNPSFEGCQEGVICLPGAARLPRRDPRAIVMVERAGTGWGFEPGSQLVHGNVSIFINSVGLRGPELPDAKAPVEQRLLSLGDSTVYGYGVRDEQVFGQVAAASLAGSLAATAHLRLVGPERGVGTPGPDRSPRSELRTQYTVAPALDAPFVDGPGPVRSAGRLPRHVLRSGEPLLGGPPDDG